MSIPELSVTEALARLTADLQAVEAERVPLERALGRVLAAEISAPHALPPFDNSAMDGYAVQAADLNGATPEDPVRLTVVGEAAAGSAELPSVGSGQAVRITTGAPLPAGADSVVPVEHTDEPGPMAGTALRAQVLIKRSAQPGAYVRRAGQDVRGGATILRAGRCLRPQDIGMLAALGASEPLVRRPVRVAVLSTGDEVVGLEDELAPGQIRDSNGHMLAAFIAATGAEPLRLGIAEDTEGSVRSHLGAALEGNADLILTSAGVSMGAHDYVRQVLTEEGSLSFWRVNIRPGKPLAHGHYGGLPFLGLPGNPVSAWITFAVFARPVILRLQGRQQGAPMMVRADLEHEIESDGRESYLRARLAHRQNRYTVRLTGSQDSGVLSSLVEANSLIRLPAGSRYVEAGATVDVWLMGGNGMVDVDADN